MTSHYYSKPTRSRTQKLVLILLLVIVLLIAALLFVWLRPGGTAPGAAAPIGSSQTSPAAAPNPTAASTSGSTNAGTSGGSVPAGTNGPAQWGTPVPGDGGPSTKSPAGVPGGYDASDSGASKAAINAVVAARWMKFRTNNPTETLGALATADAATRPEVLKQLTPQKVNYVDTGTTELETSPAGGKVLGVHLVQRDAVSARVQVLWEQFDAPAKGSMAVKVEPIGVELRWENNDWLVSGIGTFPGLDVDDPTKVIGELGQLKDWVPVPTEGWYW